MELVTDDTRKGVIDFNRLEVLKNDAVNRHGNGVFSSDEMSLVL